MSIGIYFLDTSVPQLYIFDSGVLPLLQPALIDRIESNCLKPAYFLYELFAIYFGFGFKLRGIKYALNVLDGITINPFLKITNRPCTLRISFFVITFPHYSPSQWNKYMIWYAAKPRDQGSLSNREHSSNRFIHVFPFRKLHPAGGSEGFRRSLQDQQGTPDYRPWMYGPPRVKLAPKRAILPPWSWPPA